MDKKTLVERCQHGDREALGLLYSKYSARMMKIIRHYIADPADAGDILHDGFIVAFTQISSLRNPDKLEYWLGTIMKNLSIQYLNQVELNTLLDEDADITDMPEIQDLISLEELEAIINLLPDGYRKVFKLAVLDNKSHREIGKLLGIAPHSSSSQLFRAKEMLRKIIREQGLELAGAISIILLLLALSPRIFHHEDPMLIPDIDNSGNLSLAIAAPKPTSIEKTSSIDNTFTPSAVSRPIASTSSSVNDTEESNFTLMESSTATDGNPTETTDNSSETDNAPKTGNKDNGNRTSDNSRRTISDYRYSNKLFASTSRKSPVTIGAQLRAPGFSSIGNVENDDINNIQSDLSFKDPENPTPPVPSDPIGSGRPPIREDEIEDIRHSSTLTLGITANVRLTRTLSVESGITYSYLHSKATLDNSETDYKTHYVGIPLKLNLSLYTNSRLNIYGSAGAAVDFPISSTRDMEGYRTDMNAPTQWSLSGGAGIQYSIHPHVSIYAEPSLRYNFHNSETKVVTKWQDDRFEFTLPIGLRFNF